MKKIIPLTFFFIFLFSYSEILFAQNCTWPMNIGPQILNYPANKYSVYKTAKQSANASGKFGSLKKWEAYNSHNINIKFKPYHLILEGKGVNGLFKQEIVKAVIIARGDPPRDYPYNVYTVIYKHEEKIIGSGELRLLDACYEEAVWAQFGEGRVLEITLRYGDLELGFRLKKTK